MAGIGLACGFTLVLAIACSGDSSSDGSASCTPGDTRECLWPARCPGAQVCLPDGKSFGTCDCGSGFDGGSGGSGGSGASAGSAGSAGAAGSGGAATGGTAGTGGSGGTGGNGGGDASADANSDASPPLDASTGGAAGTGGTAGTGATAGTGGTGTGGTDAGTVGPPPVKVLYWGQATINTTAVSTRTIPPTGPSTVLVQFTSGTNSTIVAAALSKDGTRVAVGRTNFMQVSSSSDGSWMASVLLGSTASAPLNLSWSPDDKWIAFTALDANDRRALWVAPGTGGSIKRISPPVVNGGVAGAVTDYAWAPNAGTPGPNCIAFNLSTPTHSIWVADVSEASPAPIKIHQNSFVHNDFDWDAQERLYFYSDYNGPYGMYRSAFPYTSFEAVPNTQMYYVVGFSEFRGFWPDPTRTKMAFAANSPNQYIYDLFRLDTATDPTPPPPALTAYTTTKTQAFGVMSDREYGAWSPDGSMIAITANWPLSSADTSTSSPFLLSSVNAWPPVRLFKHVTGQAASDYRFSKDGKRLFFRGNPDTTNGSTSEKLFMTTDFKTQDQDPFQARVDDYYRVKGFDIFP